MARYSQKSVVDVFGEPPRTLAAENELLAWLVCTPDSIDKAASIVTEECFFDPENKDVFKTLIRMNAEGERIDMGSVAEKVNRQAFYNNIVPMCDGDHTDMEISQSCSRLYEVATKRKAYFMAAKIMEDVNGGHNIESVLASMQDFINAQGLPPSSRPVPSMQEVAVQYATELQELETMRLEGRSVMIPSGIPGIDRLTNGGWGPGHLVILAARPSVGKTALMVQFAVEAARSGRRCTIYSLESENREVYRRMLCATGYVSSSDLATGRVDWARYSAAETAVTKLPIWFSDEPLDLTQLCARIRLAHRRGQCDIAFIDYLGLISFTDDRSIYQQLTEATRTIKLLAKALRIPIVLLAQLSRKNEDEHREPQLRDLRDSGSIEQDADVVMMLHPIESDVLELHMRKNRHGQRQVTVKLKQTNGYTKFYQIADAVADSGSTIEYTRADVLGAPPVGNEESERWETESRLPYSD